MLFTTALVGMALANPGTARAGLTLTSSSGTSFYAVSNTISPGPAASIFNTGTGGSFGELLAPGGGLPQLGTLGPPPYQFSSQGTLVPSFTTNATSVAPSFGTGSTQIYAATSGQEGGFTTQGGVFWTVTTSVADNLPPGSTSLASLSFSTATATFTNLSPTTPVTLTPAAILSIVGSLGGSAGSYVAAGLYTTFSVSQGATTIIPTTALDTIVLAANNAPSPNAVRIASTGSLPNEFGSISVAGSRVSGTGTSFNPGSITLGFNQSITVSSYLTLISDPGSSIGISSGLPLNFPPGPDFVPTFGVFADALGVPAAVPEPFSIVLLGSGLGLSCLWARRRRSPRADS